VTPWTILHTEASNGWGGQEIRILLEMEELRKRGHRVFLATPPHGRIFDEARRRGLPVEAISMGRRQWLTACLALRRLIRREGVTIVNTHSSADSWIGAIATRLSRPRPLLIRTRHLSTPIARGLGSRILYHMLPDGVITTGQGIRTELVTRHGVEPDRIVSLPTGVDLARFDPNRVDEGLRDAWGLRSSHVVIGTVGVLRSWKGHLVFLDAMRRVFDQRPDAMAVIVGDGAGRALLAQQIEAQQLAPRVRMVGHCVDVERAFAAIDLMVLASTGHEGVPQAILQAFAMGKPVIASNIGGIPEVVRPGETGRLVPPGDPDALSEAILRHLHAPEEGLAMARAGRRLVEREYSLDGMMGRLETFYSSVRFPKHH
jgi:glycosyltransferase involved in cell wall biosynthesis